MRSVVIMSGGVDSTVLAHMVKKRATTGDRLHAVAFDYGQRHSIELAYAELQANLLAVPIKVVRLPTLREVLRGSSQTDRTIDVPEGHYEDAAMRKTVVPNRNMVMLSIAAGYAWAIDADELLYGAHGGDHAIYPDCRTEFVYAMQEVLSLAHYKPLNLHAPFLSMTKAQIVKVGESYGVDFSKTYSCYNGDSLHCGKCGTCVERKEAFTLAKVIDPTVYR